MESALFYLEKRASEPWIIGENSDRFFDYTQQALAEINTFLQGGILPKILIAEADPIRFVADFLVAIASECPVFLGNYQWGQNEWGQVLNLVQPNLVWGLDYQIESQDYSGKFWRNDIMIPTGGSSGNIRFAIHTWQTLTASVSGFCKYFETDIVNSFCILPVCHVSGLMQFIRSLVTGGRLVISPFKQLDFNKFNYLNFDNFFISLVPSQLEKILSTEPQYLSRFKNVLLGGAPAWEELLEKARNTQIRLAPTYGMTETASQIVTLKPEDFLKGNSSSGKVLPHAEVLIENQVVKIQAKSLYLGYYPNRGKTEDITFKTDDLGYFDDQGYLHILGRNSHKIITGGENVFPSAVEAVIRSTNLVQDVCVIGLEDTYWGQVVTAVYVPINEGVKSQAIASLISPQIAKFKQPKYWISVTSISRNIQGKVNQQELLNMATNWLQQNLSNLS
ncbi:2-succinylbenzoate--CoA ligase [Merismopedia glauca]|uniref:2-succinylbenzoate-CoA ligase n=1 Tax=Merismopedia glauca CCAP 1448/3 TaxID=1296344 RepID=A0A2T1C7N0_9CYAN|nr:2-succinylbenzoate--CoA ligase [Merismopedia glauca]PSB04147.1 2-succinylbenzoate-CoA ligase [Merismopedia glauca CCAP 1448/3]